MNSDLIELLKRLDDEQIKYLIVGGYAVNYHTEPRYTKDIDLFIATDEENAQKVYRVLQAFGAPLDGVTVEDFTDEALFYQMGREPNRIDILMGMPGITFDEAWANRAEVPFRGFKLNFISLDDLIKAKRAAGREQDLRDADLLEKRKSLP